MLLALLLNSESSSDLEGSPFSMSVIGSLWKAGIMTAKIYSVSQQAVAFNVWGPVGVVLSGFAVSVAFMTSPPPDQSPTGVEPGTPDWRTASWGTAAPPAPPPYLALCPMTGLTHGTYYTWVRVNSTGTGEVPAMYAGPLFIE